jgi:hypothetical protein
VAPDAQFALGIVQQEFGELRTVRVMAAVAGHDLSGPGVHDIFSQGMIDVLPVGVAGEAHFTIGCRDFPAGGGGQMGVVTGRAILVIDQGMLEFGNFIGIRLILMAGTANISLPARE